MPINPVFATRQKRQLKRIAVVAVGDLVVFLIFGIIGASEHQAMQGNVFLRTTMPFALVWFIVAPCLGVYRTYVLDKVLVMALQVSVVWVLCSSLAIMVRFLFLDRPLTLDFAVVATATQGLLLIGWRTTFIMAFRWLRCR